MATIFHYEPDTGAFTHSTEARLDPIDGTPMVPGASTMVAPSQAPSEGQVPRWTGSTWELVPDERGRKYWDDDGVEHVISELGEVKPVDAHDAPPPPPVVSREDQRKEALAKIEFEHANYLEGLTGGATTAERDTWKVKEDAALAHVGGTALASQTAMLTAEADAKGITVDELAATINGKADQFRVLIGLASALRIGAQSAVMDATDESVPLEEVEGRLLALEAELRQTVRAALDAAEAQAGAA